MLFTPINVWRQSHTMVTIRIVFDDQRKAASGGNCVLKFNQNLWAFTNEQKQHQFASYKSFLEFNLVYKNVCLKFLQKITVVRNCKF